MITERNNDQCGEIEAPDLTDISQNRRDVFYYASYAILFLGIFIFGWEPIHVYLGIVLNMFLSIGGTILTLWIRLPIGTAFKTTIFLLPPLYLALGFTAPFFLSDVTHDMRSGTGLVLYTAAVLCSITNHYLSTTRKVERFYQYMDQKYCYEDRQPLISQGSNIIVALIHVWGTYISFLIVWLISGAMTIDLSSKNYDAIEPLGARIMAANSESFGAAIMMIVLMIGREYLGWFNMNFYGAKSEKSALLSQLGSKPIIYRDTGETVKIKRPKDWITVDLTRNS